jgi:DNA-binding transcriptional MerR regulator
MSALEDRRYRISEVSDLTEVPVHVLRQWEARFPQLKPKRDRSNRRYYMPDDIGIVRRIKELVRHEKLTTQGARLRLSQELYGEGRPKSNAEMRQLLGKIEDEARALLDMLDGD